jgi:diamine N-acetyltransferase
MKLQGERVTIRSMRRADLEAMARWRPFADPLYQPYDFPRRSRAEHRRWFEWRNQDPSRRLYTIEDEAWEVIGSLTLREIDGHASARLGVTLGADFVSKGYGTEALSLFLEYYFATLAFQQIVLDVSATNLRAVRCYQAVGFRQVGHHFRPASHPSYRLVREDPRYCHLRGFFERQGLEYRVLFYDMVLTREDWQATKRS